MSGPINPAAAAALDGMRKEFAEKALHGLHPEPVIGVERGVILGQWVAEARKKVSLSVGFVATALGVPPSLVEKLEAGEFLPWTITAVQGAELAILFRLHLNAFEELVNNSLEALEESPNAPQEETDSDRLQDVSHPNNLPPVVLQGSVIRDWLEDVRRVLEEKQARQFLD